MGSGRMSQARQATPSVSMNSRTAIVVSARFESDERNWTMRFMVLVKADKNSESGVLPAEKILTAMGKFNEELVKAGVMLAAEGLQASSRGARVKFSKGKKTVI